MDIPKPQFRPTDQKLWVWGPEACFKSGPPGVSDHKLKFDKFDYFPG